MPYGRANASNTGQQVFRCHGRDDRRRIFLRGRRRTAADPRRTLQPARPALAAALGLAFFLAGVAIIIQLLGDANDSGDLPAGTPFWLSAKQYLIGLCIFACFGAISSWIAFGPGERQFSGTFMSGDAATNAAIGRIAFGTGAVIIWLCTAAFAAFGFRKLFDHNAPNAG